MRRRSADRSLFQVQSVGWRSHSTRTRTTWDLNAFGHKERSLGPLDVIYGESRDRTTARLLADRLTKGQVSEGTVYLGYPVLATADVRAVVDALLVSRAHGLVAFLLAGSLPQNDDDWAGYIDAQDRLYAVLESDLRKHDGLRAGRRLALTIQTVTVFP